MGPIGLDVDDKAFHGSILNKTTGEMINFKCRPTLNGKNLGLLFQQMKWLDHTLTEYNNRVDELAASEKYCKQVQAPTCYRGIKTVFTMVIITEIGNIKRFAHPRSLVSFMGMEGGFIWLKGKKLGFWANQSISAAFSWSSDCHDFARCKIEVVGHTEILHQVCAYLIKSSDRYDTLLAR